MTISRTWKPIESAPKTDDGEPILACDARVLGGQFEVVFWDTDCVGDWPWQTQDGPAFHKDRFTHWMPLPKPPTMAADGEDQKR